MIILFSMLLIINTTSAYINKIPSQYISYKNVKSVMKDLYKVKSNNYNLEHIVPQSLFKKNCKLKQDMHNIIIYPVDMNMHRSNYKYISDFTFFENCKILDFKGKEIIYKKPLINRNICIKTNNKKFFLPCSKYKGPIARACMYVIGTYPKYTNEVFKNVLNPYTLLTWHHEYPVTEFERCKNNIIYDHQGNYNIYVTKPDILVPTMEDILGIDLKIFKNYEY